MGLWDDNLVTAVAAPCDARGDPQKGVESPGGISRSLSTTGVCRLQQRWWGHTGLLDLTPSHRSPWPEREGSRHPFGHRFLSHRCPWLWQEWSSRAASGSTQRGWGSEGTLQQQCGERLPKGPCQGQESPLGRPEKRGRKKGVWYKLEII